MRPRDALVPHGAHVREAGVHVTVSLSVTEIQSMNRHLLLDCSEPTVGSRVVSYFLIKFLRGSA